MSNANAVAVYKTLTGLGLSAGAATGVVGNLVAESSVDPKAVQANGPGRGIAQWSQGGRWDTLVGWAAQQNVDPWSLNGQVEFMIAEMKSSGVWDQLQQTTDPVAAATLVMRQYEKPADQSTANGQHRATLGAQALTSGGTSFWSRINPLNLPKEIAALASKGASSAAGDVTGAVTSGITSAVSSAFSSGSVRRVGFTFAGVTLGLALVAGGVYLTAKPRVGGYLSGLQDKFGAAGGAAAAAAA